MHRLLLSLALAAGFAPSAFGQAAKNNIKPEDQLIETADGVKLSGFFYKATASKNGSCVILLHEPFTDPTQGDWDGLAKTLAGEGYHVLRFDFRGHGKSKAVIPNKFWKDPLNADLPPANKANPNKTIETKDFQSKKDYYPKLVYDIAAARNHLDKFNDDGQVNTSSVYMIGAGDAATLGLLFLTTEWHREQKKPMLPLGAKKGPINANTSVVRDSAPAGRDYGGCIWLTPKRMNGFSERAVENWVSTYGRDGNGDMRRENPMLFMHGEKDDAGKKACEFFNNKVFVAAGKGATMPKLDSTYIRTAPGANLAGTKLLGKNETLKTEDTILRFLSDMENLRRKVPRITRDYTEAMPIALSTFTSN